MDQWRPHHYSRPISLAYQPARMERTKTQQHDYLGFSQVLLPITLCHLERTHNGLSSVCLLAKELDQHARSGTRQLARAAGSDCIWYAWKGDLKFTFQNTFFSLGHVSENPWKVVQGELLWIIISNISLTEKMGTSVCSWIDQIPHDSNPIRKTEHFCSTHFTEYSRVQRTRKGPYLEAPLLPK